MDVASFADIEKEFSQRVCRIAWCSVATVDRKGRPRTRILHPLWEGSTGWILTGRQSHKAKHLARNPYISLCYWDPEQEQVYADCKTEWEDRPEEKKRLWELFKSTPFPVGYDPGLFWKDTEDPTYGVLKLIPWRVELYSMAEMGGGHPPKVWRALTK
jgi:general stress protein 26